MITESRLETALKNGQALKVISGLTNFDQDRVAATVKAATLGGATFLDIAADPNLVEMARSLTNLPICVSAIEPAKFVPAVEAGAINRLNNEVAMIAAVRSLVEALANVSHVKVGSMYF